MAMFNAKLQAKKDYWLLDYIRTSGSQYINTGEAPVYGTLKAKFKSASSTDMNTAWGAEVYAVANFAYRWSSSSSGGSNKFQFFPSGEAVAVSLSTLQEMEATVDGTSILVKVNGTTYLSKSYTYTMPTIPVYIGCVNKNNNAEKFANVTIYYFELRDTLDKIVYSFVPVIRKSDGAIGMYNKKNKQFYGNSGSGTFTAGSVIGEI